MNTTQIDRTLVVPFDSLTLRAVTEELRPRLLGGQVQEIRQPVPEETQLGIRCQGRNYRLALSCDSRFARAHLTGVRAANAPVPTAFCMALRKYLEGGVIREVRQRGFDRILDLMVETRLDDGEPFLALLVAELMGKHSNLILLAPKPEASLVGIPSEEDFTGYRIVEAARRVAHRVNRHREVLPGRPYTPPPAPAEKWDPFAPETLARLLTEQRALPEITQETLCALLMNRVAGMSPFLARELAKRACDPTSRPSLPDSPAVQEGRGEAVIQTAPSSLARNAQAGEEAGRAGLEAAWDFIFGAMARGERHPVALHTPEPAAYPVPVVQVPAEAQTPVEDLNRALDAAYAARLEQAGFVSLIAEFAGRVEQALKRLRRREQSVERALQEAERAETYQQSGELLLANLWRVQPGDTSVTVTDYYALEPVERAISLDAQLSPQENAEAYFRRARKTRAAAARAQEERAAVRQDMERLETAARALELWRAEGPGAEETVRRLREELTAEGLLRSDRTGETEGDRHARPDFQGHKIRRYTTPEGYEILVGESATANDFLTTRVAAPNDLWLHVRAAASAHVVIRTQGHPERVPRSVLEEAARLCVQHSGQKHSSLVPVDYTLKKFVRKPRKAPPGTVQIQQEKTLHITP